MKTVKFFFFTTVFVAVCVVFTACSDSLSTKRLPKNDILGNVPSLVYQKVQQDSILEAKFAAEVRNVTDSHNFTQLIEKYEKMKEDAEKKFKEALTKEQENLIDKEIPFQIAEGLGYEVTSVKIGNVTKDGEIEFTFTIKIIDASNVDLSFPFDRYQKGQIRIPVQMINKAGEVFGKDSYLVFLEESGVQKSSDLINGMEFSQWNGFTITEYNAEAYADFAKIKFLPSEKMSY